VNRGAQEGPAMRRQPSSSCKVAIADSAQAGPAGVAPLERGCTECFGDGDTCDERRGAAPFGPALANHPDFIAMLAPVPLPSFRTSTLALACLSLAVVLSACPTAAPTSKSPTASTEPTPPIAKILAHALVAHGHTRIDNYYWMHDRTDPEVIAYLEAENAYTATMTADSKQLRATLLEELVGRIKQDDSSVPYRIHDHYYYRRWAQGADYPVYCRKQGSLDAAEQIMLDAEALAAEHSYFDVGALAVSEDARLLAYSTDVVGRRIHTIYFKDLQTGELLPDMIPEVTGSLVWANDNRTLFYTKQDPQTLREFQVYRHTLGEDPRADVLVYEERDPTFELGIGKTKSRKFVIIHSYQTLSDEVRLLDADAPSSEPRVVQPRERGLEYDVDHRGDRLYIRTNLDAPNFRLVEAPLEHPDKQHWRELVGHRDDVLIDGFELFANHLVVVQSRAGLSEFEVHGLDGATPQTVHTVAFGDPTYVAYPDDNVELETSTLRYVYESLTTPPTVYDYDLDTRAQTLQKRTEVLGGFDPEHYASERLWAPGRYGAEVPISLVYRKRPDGARPGPAPLLLHGYGAYGENTDPEFSSELLSLLDRGFIFAIAHVRGGEELGRSWYEQGKLFAKRNTFTDFIDCAEFLRAQGYADPERLFATGGSAGGLLIGAVINMRPDLFRGVIAQVPFVDVVSTMLDDSIPLTAVEYDEWGDPHRFADYKYMLSYSPYDNVGNVTYPAMLVTTGLHDSQVQYWEPAKWVAKLRAHKTDQQLLLLRVDMSAGHGGQAGRLESLEEVAFEYAFLLGLTESR
jgi:oligopeptidase B